MKPKLKKLDYKGVQKVTRQLLKMGHPLIEGVTANLGIREFKRTNASPAEVKAFKDKAWKGVQDDRDGRQKKVSVPGLQKQRGGSRKKGSK